MCIVESNRVTGWPRCKIYSASKADLDIIVDGSASVHVVSSHELLTCVQEIPPILLELAKVTTISARYRGVRDIDVGGQVNLTFKEYLVPTLKLNLLSCSQLDDYGITSNFEKGRCMLTDRKNGVTLATALSAMGTTFTLQE